MSQMTERELKEHEVMFATYSVPGTGRGLALVAEVRRCWAELKELRQIVGTHQAQVTRQAEQIVDLKKSQGSAPKPYEDAVWALSDLTPEV